MLTWGKAILALAQLLALILTYAREKELLSAGEQQAISDVLNQQMELVNKANEAAEKAGDYIDSVPDNGELRDEFRRD